MTAAVTRFLGYVEPVETGCWLWTASVNHRGYGQFRFGNTMAKAHRVGYELLVGPIPEGLTLDHLCRIPRCVNPDHLEPVTLTDNIARAVKANMTHCKRGHEFTPENTRVFNGCRRCLACQAAAAKSYREKAKRSACV